MSDRKRRSLVVDSESEEESDGLRNVSGRAGFVPDETGSGQSMPLDSPVGSTSVPISIVSQTVETGSPKMIDSSALESVSSIISVSPSPRGQKRLRLSRKISFDSGSDPLSAPVMDPASESSIPPMSDSLVKPSVDTPPLTKPGVRRELIVKNGVAVDEFCPRSDVHVYMHVGKPCHAMLSQTDITYGVKGNNKYYLIQLLEADRGGDFYLFCRWGRVGYDGQSSWQEYDTCDHAVRAFQKKFYDKTRNNFGHTFIAHPRKYDLVDLDFGDAVGMDLNDREGSISVRKECSLPSPVQEVLRQICDRSGMRETLLEYDVDLQQMPLGKLTQDHIKKGYASLAEIHSLLPGGQVLDRRRLVEETNRFYSLIPHNFGYRVPPLIDSLQLLHSRMQMLEALADIEIAQTSLDERKNVLSLHPLDFQYNQLGAELVVIPRDDEIFRIVGQYLTNTHAPSHSNFRTRLVDVFSIRRGSEERAFAPFLRLWNHHLLWHGSGVSNVFGILKEGLRIAPGECPRTGNMFGRAIYLTDVSSKAANYTQLPRLNKSGIAYLFLVRSALGTKHPCVKAEFFKDPPPGTHSVWGVGRKCPNPAQAREREGVTIPFGELEDNTDFEDSALRYNEYAIFDTHQVKLEYLVKVEFTAIK